MYCSGFSTFSTRTTPRSRMSCGVSVLLGGTTPGQSIKYIRFISVIYCQILVSPGIGATVHTFFFRNVLMIEDLPVLGYPMKPTEICFRSEWRDENWRRREIREPLPKELVMDAWNASVG